MSEQDITDAYLTIRKENNTIPDNVLDYMRESALKRLNGKLINEFTRAELQEALNKY